MTDASERVPLAVWAVAFLVLIFIPFKIIAYDYLPGDDALADAAKAVSGKSWQQILILKSDYKIDNHIGWHTFLRKFYEATHWDDEKIVLFSVVSLSAVFLLSGLPWMERPEAWLMAIALGAGLETYYMPRLMMGRPLLLSMAALVTILMLWKKRGQSPPGKFDFAVMIVCMTIAILLHGVWYFWAMPIVAMFMAREFRWSIALGVCWIVATLLGGVLTGQPWTYLSAAWLQAWNVIGRHSTQSTLVTELRPAGSSLLPLLLMGGLLLLRILGRLPVRRLSRDPVFWMAVIGWLAEHQAQRFWDDWGAPALWVLMAWDLQAFLRLHVPETSFQRLAVTGGAAIALFLMTTNDIDSRWTSSLTAPYLSQDDPKLQGWLPGNGGIFYKADMGFFYQTFYHNPTAPWRYIVGYEPIMMPTNDFATYQRILWNDDNPEAYLPWILKMRPEDRMVLEARSNPSNYVPGLQWKLAVGTMWLGRLPEHTNALNRNIYPPPIGHAPQ